MAFTLRDARRRIRKAVSRVPEGEEIRHLNIMPMMDMMTILLVAFIAQTATALELAASAVTVPPTLSDDDLPPDAATLVIGKTGILVEGKPIVPITEGQVDPSMKEGGALGIKIPVLTDFLAALHHQHEEVRRKDPKYDPRTAGPPELMIIADRTTPYRLLIEVMFSAKQKEAGYKRFRLIVQKSYPVQPER